MHDDSCEALKQMQSLSDFDRICALWTCAVAERLNRALEIDREAVMTLTNDETPCKPELSEVFSLREGQNNVRLLGVLNGIMPSPKYCVVGCSTETGELEFFSCFNRETKECIQLKLLPPDQPENSKNDIADSAG